MRKKICIFIACLIFGSVIYFYFTASNSNLSIMVSNLLFPSVTPIYIENPDENISNEDKIISYRKLLNNNDVVGKIMIAETNIHHYIFLTDNNSYYLNHLFDHSSNKAGEVFLDYRNQISDKKLLIYGHNFASSTNGKFHDLIKYVEEEFYQKHSYIQLETSLEDSTWQIFSVMIVSGNNFPHTILKFDDAKWIEHIEWMKNKSLYHTGIEVNKEDYVLTLQTCYYDSSNSYLVVNAKKI